MFTDRCTGCPAVRKRFTGLTCTAVGYVSEPGRDTYRVCVCFYCETGQPEHYGPPVGCEIANDSNDIVCTV